MSIYGNYVKENAAMQIKNAMATYLNYDIDETQLSESEMEAIHQELSIDSVNEAIDMDDGYGAALRPVFIVLLYSDSDFDHTAEKFVKNQDYWHAAIGFGPALSRCYSFNYGEASANKIKGGLSFESLKFYKTAHPTGTMQVSCVFLTPFKYKKLKATLDYYLRNKEKTRYSFINLLYSLFGHKTKNGLKLNLVCSTFVDTILKSVNVDLNNGKTTNLVKPDDLKANDSKPKQFKVYQGRIVGYMPKRIAGIVEKLANDVNSNYFSKKRSK